MGWEVWPALPGLIPALSLADRLRTEPFQEKAFLQTFMAGVRSGGRPLAEASWGAGTSSPSVCCAGLDGEHWGVAGLGWRGAMLAGLAQPATCRVSKN